MASHSKDLRTQALTDIWKFAQLLKFKGGVDNFSRVHFEMTEPLESQLKQPYVDQVISGNLLEIPTTFVCSVPRGHLKSTVRTTLYTLWRVYRNPNIRICIGTNIEPLATSLIRELRSYLENEDLQRTVWNNRPHISGNLIPELAVGNRRTRRNDVNAIDDYATDTVEKKVIWNNKALQVNRDGIFKEPTIDTTCLGAINTGNHYDVVIFDDVVDFRNSDTINKQEKLARWCFDIESQLDPIRVVKVAKGLQDVLGNTKVINGTKYYDGDYGNQLIIQARGNPSDDLEPDKTIQVYERSIYNNGKDETDGYLWGEKFNHAIVTLLKRKMDKKTFSSQYLNTTASEFGQSQSGIDFGRIGGDQVSTLGGSVNYYDEAGNRHIVQLRGICDIGIKNDFSVCIIGFYLNKDTFVVFDVTYNQGNLSKFLEEVYAMSVLYNVSYIGIEANGVGAGCTTSLKLIHDRERNGKRFCFYDFYSTDSKDTRIAYAVTFLKSETSKVLLTPKVATNSLFVRYIRGFPYAEHDDFIDCMGMALRKIPKSTPEFVPDANDAYTTGSRQHAT